MKLVKNDFENTVILCFFTMAGTYKILLSKKLSEILWTEYATNTYRGIFEIHRKVEREEL